MDDRLKEAIQLVQRGQNPAARLLLTEILRQEPGNEEAWLWLVDACDTDEERVIVLQRCLQNIPTSQTARQVLSELRKNQSMLDEEPTPPPAAPIRPPRANGSTPRPRMQLPQQRPINLPTPPPIQQQRPAGSQQSTRKRPGGGLPNRPMKPQTGGIVLIGAAVVTLIALAFSFISGLVPWPFERPTTLDIPSGAIHGALSPTRTPGPLTKLPISLRVALSGETGLWILKSDRRPIYSDLEQSYMPVSIAPDGTGVAYLKHGDTLWVLLEDGTVRNKAIDAAMITATDPASKPAVERLGSFAWLADSQTILVEFASGGANPGLLGFARVDVKSGVMTVLARFQEPGPPPGSAIFSPDGKYVLLVNDGQVGLVNLITGAYYTNVTQFSLLPGVRWQNDSSAALLTGFETRPGMQSGTLSVMRIAPDGRVSRLISQPDVRIDSGLPAASVSPDGTWLAYITASGVWLQNLAGDASRQVFEGDAYGLAWSHNSQSLAFAVNGQGGLAITIGSDTHQQLGRPTDLLRPLDWASDNVVVYRARNGNRWDVYMQTLGNESMLVVEDQAGDSTAGKLLVDLWLAK